MAKSATDKAKPRSKPRAQTAGAAAEPIAPIVPRSSELPPVSLVDPARREPLLTLAQLDPLTREFVLIDGVAYDLANRDTWGLKQRLAVKHLTDRCEELEKLVEPTPEEEAEYVQRLRGLVQTALPDLPGEVLDRLLPGQLSDIWVSFLACLVQKGKAGPLMMLMKRAGVM
jgi:hypothetical protein